MGHPRGNKLCHPNSSMSNSANSGIKIVGAWLLGIVWLGLVFGGLAIAFTPSPHSPVLGFLLIGIAAVILAFTVNKWVKVFPGLLAYGILGSVLTLVEGHVVNHPEVTVSHQKAVAMILYFAGATGLSLTFLKRKLSVVDRFAILAFVFCFFWQAVIPNLMVVALGVGLFCLIIAWAYDRAGMGRKRNHKASPVNTSS
jgi:hypothetical protein